MHMDYILLICTQLDEGVIIVILLRIDFLDAISHFSSSYVNVQCADGWLLSV